MRLSEYCGFATLWDSLIRDRLILGIKNDRVRKKLLEQKDLTLDKALDILRTAELAEIRASEISTEEANVNRVKPRKTKSPNSRTENNKSPMQTMVKQQIPPFKPKAKGALCKISATPVRSSECKFCGTAHEMKKSACPAVGKKRITWDKEGHFTKKIGYSSVNHVEDCEIFSHKPSSKSAYVTVLLNNETEVQLQIDTGASCNILPQRYDTTPL